MPRNVSETEIAKKMKEKMGNATTLDHYLKFRENPYETTNLTKDQLNQIVSMHGFVKLHHYQKKDIVEALSSLDLLIPYRSTVHDNSSSSASLSDEDVISDLCSLEWDECSVQSVERVGLVNEDEFGAAEEEEKKRKKCSMKKLDMLSVAALAAFLHHQVPLVIGRVVSREEKSLLETPF